VVRASGAVIHTGPRRGSIEALPRGNCGGGLPPASTPSGQAALPRRSGTGKSPCDGRGGEGQDAAASRGRRAAQPKTRAKVNQLLDRYLETLGVEPTTRMRYEGIIRSHLRPALGSLPLSSSTATSPTASSARCAAVASAATIGSRTSSTGRGASTSATTSASSFRAGPHETVPGCSARVAEPVGDGPAADAGGVGLPAAESPRPALHDRCGRSGPPHAPSGHWVVARQTRAGPLADGQGRVAAAPPTGEGWNRSLCGFLTPWSST
jgi:hypothetical protein